MAKAQHAPLGLQARCSSGGKQAAQGEWRIDFGVIDLMVPCDNWQLSLITRQGPKISLRKWPALWDVVQRLNKDKSIHLRKQLGTQKKRRRPHAGQPQFENHLWKKDPYHEVKRAQYSLGSWNLASKALHLRSSLSVSVFMCAWVCVCARACPCMCVPAQINHAPVSLSLYGYISLLLHVWPRLIGPLDSSRQMQLIAA